MIVQKNRRSIFYQKSVDSIIKDKNSTILICGGGIFDKDTFQKLGFKNVTISNLDVRMQGNEFEPFQWKYENAEDLSFEDNYFDYVVIHASIHHASSPHRVLTEMYRVAKKGILAIESRDSVIMRLLIKCGWTLNYEHEAVFHHECKYGGVNNTEIPNYIYRWTEREIEKTIQSYAPCFEHNFIYKYGYDFPFTPKKEKGGGSKYVILKIFEPFYKVFVKLFPKQQNLFSFYIEKPNSNNSLFTWLKIEDNGKITFNKEWAEQKYKSKKNDFYNSTV